MAHFAKLGKGNIIEKVNVVSNDIATSEQAGVDFLNNLYNTRDVWKQTSYNHNFRKRFASIGGTYDDVNDVFISPKPYESWVLNDNYAWEAPVPYPTDNEDSHIWNEETQSWIEI